MVDLRRPDEAVRAFLAMRRHGAFGGLLQRVDLVARRALRCSGRAAGRRTDDAFGAVLYNLYGSTEVAVAAVATPHDLRQAPGTVGKPPVGCTLAVYDEKRRRITELGRTGTFVVSSGLSFAGTPTVETKRSSTACYPLATWAFRRDRPVVRRWPRRRHDRLRRRERLPAGSREPAR